VGGPGLFCAAHNSKVGAIPRRSQPAHWLAAARVFLVTRHSYGWDLTTTEPEMAEGRLRAVGWACRWAGSDLVVELPGWIQSEPVIVAIPPGLFD
jgi:hypothetical protein